MAAREGKNESSHRYLECNTTFDLCDALVAGDFGDGGVHEIM
jgi:hypothetical protein